MIAFDIMKKIFQVIHVMQNPNTVSVCFFYNLSLFIVIPTIFKNYVYLCLRKAAPALSSDRPKIGSGTG